MKTLDEVIKALEICGHDESPKCPYFDTEHWCCCEDHMRSISPLKNDVLIYLKQYQRDKQIYAYDIAKRILELSERNDPLTWDELKILEGKPVWVEVYDPIDEKTGWHTASWKLIEFINDEYFDVRDSNGEQECFYKSENDWQAYRKERE